MVVVVGMGKMGDGEKLKKLEIWGGGNGKTGREGMGVEERKGGGNGEEGKGGGKGEGGMGVVEIKRGW